jgi:hypothetical protein
MDADMSEGNLLQGAQSHAWLGCAAAPRGILRERVRARKLSYGPLILQRIYAASPTGWHRTA